MSSSRTLVVEPRRHTRLDVSAGASAAAGPGPGPHASRRRRHPRLPARRDRLLEARPGSGRRRRLLDAAEPLRAGSGGRAWDRARRAATRPADREGALEPVLPDARDCALAFGRATVHLALLNTITAEHNAAWRKQIRDARRLLGTRPRGRDGDRPRDARQSSSPTRRARASRRGRRSSSGRSATAATA